MDLPKERIPLQDADERRFRQEIDHGLRIILFQGPDDRRRQEDVAEAAELDARLAEAKVLVAKSDAQISALQLKIARLRKQLGAQQ